MNRRKPATLLGEISWGINFSRLILVGFGLARNVEVWVGQVPQCFRAAHQAVHQRPVIFIGGSANLEDHPMTCKWFITMVNKSLK